MKKILFLHNTLRMGGAERMRHMLLKNFDRKDYEIKICCLGDKGELGRTIENLGYEIDELHLNRNSRSPFVTYKLIKYLQRQKIDILHTCLFSSNFHGRIAAGFCRIPFVITEEHSEHYLYRKFRHFFYILADRILSRSTDRIICCSEAVREDIIKKEKLNSGKLLAIRNCIDPDMYNISTPPGSIREKFNITNDEIVFITVASFAPKKRHSYLLSVLKDVKDAGRNFKCFFAGGMGPTEAAARSQARELGLADDVIFLGRVDNIQDYLNASDAFVLPSFKEGLSIALMEAMYIGLPCIASDIDANRELIENGTNGILVPLEDRAGLRKALISCFSDRQAIRAMGKAARERVEKDFLVTDYVRKFREVWDSVGR